MLGTVGTCLVFLLLLLELAAVLPPLLFWLLGDWSDAGVSGALTSSLLFCHGIVYKILLSYFQNKI